MLPLLPEVLKHPLCRQRTGLDPVVRADARDGRQRRDGGHRRDHPHNAYLEALLDLGVLGLALLCAYYWHVWKGLRTLGADPALSPVLRGFYQGAAAGLAALLIAGVTDGSLAPRSEQAFLWRAIGMMYGQRAAAERHG